MEWLYLGGAILFEVAGTTSMKLSAGFSKPLFIIPLVFFYVISLGLLTLAIKRIDVGTAYAIWSGVGTALIATVGFILFKDQVTALKMLCLGLIIAGVVGLRLVDNAAG